MLARQRLDHAVKGRGSEVASSPLGASQCGGHLIEVSTSLLQRQPKVVCAKSITTLVSTSKRGDSAG